MPDSQRQLDFDSVKTAIFKRLKKDGFNDSQISILESKDDMIPLITFLDDKYDELVKIFEQTEQSRDKDIYIMRIVKHQKGAVNLAAFLEYAGGLLENGFSLDTIMNMIDYNNGANNLKTVNDNFETLSSYGFTCEQIKKIILSDDGVNKIKMAISDGLILSQNGFTPANITSLLSKRNSVNLTNIIKEKLQQEKVLVPKDIMKIVRGFNSVERLAQYPHVNKPSVKKKVAIVKEKPRREPRVRITPVPIRPKPSDTRLEQPKKGTNPLRRAQPAVPQSSSKLTLDMLKFLWEPAPTPAPSHERKPSPAAFFATPVTGKRQYEGTGAWWDARPYKTRRK